MGKPPVDFLVVLIGDASGSHCQGCRTPLRTWSRAYALETAEVREAPPVLGGAPREPPRACRARAPRGCMRRGLHLSRAQSQVEVQLHMVLAIFLPVLCRRLRRHA